MTKKILTSPTDPEFELPYGAGLLKNEYEKRKNKNPHYSLRAFARDLGLGKTTLCDYLNHKRKISLKNCEKIVNKLYLSPLEENIFKSEISSQKKYPYGPSNGHEEKQRKLLMKEDQFQLISEWYYLAILNIVQQGECPYDPVLIANRLSMDPNVVKQAIDRLLRLDLVRIDQNQLHRVKGPLTTTRDIPSKAIQKYHQGVLDLAKGKISDDNLLLRDFNALTFPFDPNRMPEAKKMIKQFKKKLLKKLEATHHSSADQVYLLSLQFFPVTQ